jgi:hypothetical protein
MKHFSYSTVRIINLLKNVSWLNSLTDLKSCKADPSGRAV